MELHEPVTLAFPPPAVGCRRHGEWARGPWRLWVDARAIDPRRHVVSFELHVWRARAGEAPTLLHHVASAYGRLGAALGEAGDVALSLHRATTHHPVSGPPRPVVIPGAEWSAPVVVLVDGVVLRAGLLHGGPQRLLLLGFDGALRELEVHPEDPDRNRDPLHAIGPVRGGRWLCWLARGDDGRARAVRVLDLEAGGGPRDLCALPRVEHEPELVLDGVAGGWLLAHSGSRVRLFALDDGREHVLHAPHEVMAVHPRRVLCQRPDRQGQRFVLWDPLRPVDRRHMWVPAGPVVAYHDDERVLIEPDRFLVPGPRGHEVVPLDPPVGPAPAALRRLAEPAWEALKAQRAALLGRRPPHGQEEGTAWRSANDALSRAVAVGWLLEAEHVELLESLGRALDSNVGAQAAWHLGRFGGEAARQALLRMLASRPAFFVLEAILESLATTGGPEDAAALLAANPTDPFVERFARALGLLGDPAAIPWLEAHREVRLPLRESVDGARAAVDEAIGRLRARPAALAAWAALPG